MLHVVSKYIQERTVRSISHTSNQERVILQACDFIGIVHVLRRLRMGFKMPVGHVGSGHGISDFIV